MHELMFQAGVKGMSERSELIPCNSIITLNCVELYTNCIAIRASNLKFILDSYT